MKKVIAIITLAAVLGCTGCEGSKEETETKVENTTTSSAASETVTEAAEETTEAAEDETEEAVSPADDSWYEYHDLKFYWPNDYESRNENFDGTKHSHYDSDDDIIYTWSPRYSYATGGLCEDPNYTAKDVPEIIKRNIGKIINQDFEFSNVSSEFAPETEEEKDVLGFEFIKQVGVIHAEEEDLRYAAYFGVIDLDDGDGVRTPIVWIAYSKADDDATKAELERLVDTAAETAILEK